MTITFITGANKGLGFETARRLIAAGHSVILGARDADRGRGAAETLGARFVAIDVADDDSVAAAARDVAANEGHIDVLVNNAGIVGPPSRAEDLTGADAVTVFNTNVGGIVRVTHAFLPLLRRSQHPTIVNVGSGVGSLTLTHDPDRVESHVVSPLYTSSKAAVAMLSMQYAKALPDIRVNCADPGYTATDLNANSGHQSVAEGTDAIVTLASEAPDAGTGRWIDRYGDVSW